MYIRDIMTVPAISVTGDTTLEKALDLLAKHKISGAPVVDQGLQVIGIFSEKDIARYAAEEKIVLFTQMTGINKYGQEVMDTALLKKSMDLLAKNAVQKVMTPSVFTVTEDTLITNAAVIMNRHRVNRVPVVAADGRLKGIVTRADLVKFLADREQLMR